MITYLLQPPTVSEMTRQYDRIVSRSLLCIEFMLATELQWQSLLKGAVRSSGEEIQPCLYLKYE